MRIVVLLTLCYCTAGVEEVRLVDGDGRCSGTPEVFTEGEWRRVNSLHFTYETGDIMCKELNCGFMNTVERNFTYTANMVSGIVIVCRGSESALSQCISISNSTFNKSHFLLRCSGVTEVRLVDGDGRCSGTPEVFQEGTWKRLSQTSFNNESAVVVCRDLDCGDVINVSFQRNFGHGNNERSEINIKCTGSQTVVSQCWFSSVPHSEFLNISPVLTCTGVEEVRLVDGDGRCSGTLEVFTEGEWRRMNPTLFNKEAAAVVCRELNCGNVTSVSVRSNFTHDNKEKPGISVICKGSESFVSECEYDSSDSSDFLYILCSAQDVRLVNASSRCAGLLEMFHNGKWRRVSFIYNNENISHADKVLGGASLVCKQLNCGSAIAATSVEKQEATDSVDIFCKGSESTPQKCTIFYSGFASHFGVVCSEVLATPTISFSTPIQVYGGLQGSEVIRGHSFTITCSTEPQFAGGCFHLTVPWMERNQTQAAVGHSASFFFPAAAAELHQGNYRCVYENLLNITADVITGEISELSGSYVQVFTSESHFLSITVTDSPLPAVITRMVLVPFLLFMSCLAIYFYLKRRLSPQREAALQYENIKRSEALKTRRFREIVSERKRDFISS